MCGVDALYARRQSTLQKAVAMILAASRPEAPAVAVVPQGVTVFPAVVPDQATKTSGSELDVEVRCQTQARPWQ
jgi:hypothetical protein